MKPKLTKVCSRCLKLRPLGEFLPHQGKGHVCRRCYLAYFRQYNATRCGTEQGRTAEQERGRQKYAVNIRPGRLERKRRLVAMFGGKCCRCGYARSIAALDFDHLGGKTHRGKPNPKKRRTLSHLLAQVSPAAFKLAIAEAKKCRLVCANCHREITFPDAGFP